MANSRLRQHLIEINKDNYKTNDGHNKLLETISSGFGKLAEDCPELLDIKGFAGHMKLGQLVNKLNNGTTYYGYCIHGNMLACFGLEDKGQGAYKLINLAVKGHVWGQGLGKLMMTFAESIVLESDGKALSLGMVASNKRLKRWYLDLGYEISKEKGKILFMKKSLEYWITVNNFSKEINNSGDNCKVCGMWEPACICDQLDGNQGRLPIKIVLLSHENELERLTNTGRVVKGTFPVDTHVVKWQRKRPSDLLLKFIESHKTYLVFPSQFTEGTQVAIEEVAHDSVFILIDSTWDEAKKIVRKSDYLKKLPIVSFDVTEASAYTLRRNQEKGALCTAEIAIKLCGDLNLDMARNLLAHNFSSFLSNFDRSQKQLNLTRT